MPERNWGCRLSLDHSYKGYRLAVLENEQLRVSVLLDKGADIVEFQHKPSGTDYMWWTPWGLHPNGRFTPTAVDQHGFFGDRYQGTWQEIIPNGGGASRHQKMDYGLHGEASLQAWDAKVLKDTPEEILLEVSVETYRSPFRLTRRMGMKRGQASLFLDEEMRNLSGVAMDAMWGHHPCFGAPFLNENVRLDIAGGTLVHEDRKNPNQRAAGGSKGRWPYLPGKDGGRVDFSRFPKPGKPVFDMVYVTDLKAGWYGLTDAKKKLGFGLAWDKKVWGQLWFWGVYNGLEDGPFWGRTYNAAVEPFAGWPGGLANAAANGSALRFKPHEAKRSWLTAVAYAGKSKVRGISRSGAVR
jgi:hypothetical protein